MMSTAVVYLLSMLVLTQFHSPGTEILMPVKVLRRGRQWWLRLTYRLADAGW